MDNIITSVEFDILYENTFIDSTSFKIFHGIASFLAEFMAIFCYLGMIHFEFYGGDPMKRSIKNKLVAEICKSILTAAFTSTPGINWSYENQG